MPESHPPTLNGPDYFPDARLPLCVVPSVHESSNEHAHSFVEIVLVTGGSGSHMRRPQGGKPITYDLFENDVFVVPVGWSHSYQNCRALNIYNIIFAPELIEKDFISQSNSAGSFALFAGRSHRPDEGLVYKLHLRHATRLAAESLIKSIRRETMTRRHGYELVAKARLLELLALLERATDDRPSEPVDSSSGNAVADAIRYVEDHYDQPVGLQDIASAVGLNPNYLCERFGQVTGISPVKYLTRLRVEHAKGLLLTTDLPVTEVAMRSGFSDSSYFARIFRRAVGRTPSAFREEVGMI